MQKADDSAGDALYALAERLYPFNRSITGNGVRRSLRLLQDLIPIEIFEVPSGTAVFDWTVPDEWNVREAWIKDSNGETVVDFAEHNLHLLNYSEPVKARLSLDELRPHIHTLPEQPSLTPYKTSYYHRTWGFCMPHQQLEALGPGPYDVVVDATLEPGSLTYGELVLPGTSGQEFLFSAHICHPSLANDNLSGISVLTHLASRLLHQENRHSYRFLFAPGTIGAVTWLAGNQSIAQRLRGGLVASLLGDEGDFTYKRSRQAISDFDRLIEYALTESGYRHDVVDFTPYGYDERQYCSPGFNLAVGNLSRSVHGTFPEYHTSADNLEFISRPAMAQSLDLFGRIVDVLESAEYYESRNQHCEPQLGKHGLYDSLGGKRSDSNEILAMLWMMGESDGRQSIQAISQRSGIGVQRLRAAAARLIKAGLMSSLSPACRR